jgi:DNA-binding response OmpR family regulator
MGDLMFNYRIALVEDDLDLAEEIGFQLGHYGMDVVLFENCKKFEAWLKKNQCHLVLLDLNLPDCDGLEIAKKIANIPDLRIVMLTARVMTIDRIAGFDAGADAYLQKPVDLKELISVIKRLLQRLPIQKQVWKLQTENSQIVMPNGEAIKLTSNENRFLQLLKNASNYFLTRDELENGLWGTSDLHTARRLEVLISRLRQKLDYKLIQTNWGGGYSLNVELD